METRIKTRYGTICYDRAMNFSLLEGLFLSKEIKHANSADYATRHATLNNGGKVKKEEVDKLKGRLIFSGRFKKDIF